RAMEAGGDPPAADHLGRPGPGQTSLDADGGCGLGREPIAPVNGGSFLGAGRAASVAGGGELPAPWTACQGTGSRRSCQCRARRWCTPSLLGGHGSAFPQGVVRTSRKVV